jgi:DNA-binding response OmpR family regulator
VPDSRRRTRVHVIHRGRRLAARLRAQLAGLDNVDVNFTAAARAMALPPPADAPDVIVFDLALATPPGFRIHRILQPRSSDAPPVVILRRQGDGRATHKDGKRWTVTTGVEALESRVQCALGRRARRRSWLPLRFAGSHLTADLPNTHVLVDGRPVAISAREAEVLGFLLAHRNRLVPRDVLVAEIWGYETHSIAVQVRRLRQKLGSAGAQLETVKQFGYRFVEPDATGVTMSSSRSADSEKFYRDETTPL